MTTKKGVQFSFEECSCMQMMSHFKGQQGVGEAWAEIMAQFDNAQSDGGEYLEMMSQMMASCCGIEQEEDNITRAS